VTSILISITHVTAEQEVTYNDTNILRKIYFFIVSKFKIAFHDYLFFRRGLMTYRLLLVALHYHQSVLRPLGFLFKQAKAGSHGCGECLFSLQWQFRLFFPGCSQSDKSYSLE
jgi:hypothetical protein